MAADQIRYSVLGSVRSWRRGAELDLGQPKQRAVLVTLLLNANRVVPQSAIVDGVWGERAPASAANLIHTYMSRLRRVLEPSRPGRGAGDLLESSGPGYVLRVRDGELDLDDFDVLVRRARAHRHAADPAGAVGAYTGALALWSGPPLAGIPGPLAVTERARLDELRMTVALERAEVMLDLGGHGQVAGDLSALAAEYPLQERIVALLMTALCHSGRQAEAVAAYSRTQALLADELGIDPGPELQHLHRQILAGDPVMAAVSGTGHQAGPAPRRWPAAAEPFAGHPPRLRQLTDMLSGAVGQEGTVVISAINATAGTGRTALEVHWSYRAADSLPGGQLQVHLRGFDTTGTPVHPGAALRDFLQALGLPPGQILLGPDGTAGSCDTMLPGGQRVLVMLDNGTLKRGA